MRSMLLTLCGDHLLTRRSTQTPAGGACSRQGLRPAGLASGAAEGYLVSLAGFQGEDLAFENTGRELAPWAQRYFAGGLSFEQFFDLVPGETEDEDVAELLDLIEHEAQRGGMLGARPRTMTGTWAGSKN